MIELIIDRVMNDKDIVEQYNLNSVISYRKTHTSMCRSYERIRSIFIIFSHGIPVLSVKFYNDKKSNTMLEREFNLQKTMFEKYKDLTIPVPVGLFEIDGLSVMIEEAVDGKMLYQLLKEDITVQNLYHAIELANKIQTHLNKIMTPSDCKYFESELQELTSQFMALYKPTPAETSLIMTYTKLLIDESKNKNIYKRYTNGDLNASNILLDGKNRLILLDFEFVKETHFYFLEWFQFIASLPIPYKMIDITSAYSDPILLNALSFFKHQTVSNNPVAKAQCLLFYMQNLIINSETFPKNELKALRRSIKFELRRLFVASNTKQPEFVRLVATSLFILKAYGIKDLFEALVEKIRVRCFSSTYA